MKDSIEIVEKNKCCACFACVNACPKKCISMLKDGTGSLYPHIDHSACISCGRCTNVCAAINSVQANEPKAVYAAYSKEKTVRKASTSGGLATEIAKYIIGCGGVVYGAAMVDMEVKHIRVTSKEDIAKIQGSKYVHSHMHDIYKQLQTDVEQGTLVAFIGTPCQVAAVVCYLKSVPKNLYLIDILCHGVSSLDCFLQGIKLETKGDISSVSFRDGNKYCLKGYDANGKCVFETPYRASYWMNSFVEGSIFRENCYSCKYSGKKRCGDITLGDFWGLKNNYDVSQGVNFVAINTNAGEDLWNKISMYLNFEERSIEEAIPYNHPLRAPASKSKNYGKFQTLYQKNAARALTMAYLDKTFYIGIRRIIWKNKTVYKIVTSIPGVGKKFKVFV